MAKEVQPFDEAQLIAQLRELGITVDSVIDTEAMAEDFKTADKEALINYPFVIYEVTLKESLKFNNGEFAIVKAVDRDGNQIVFTDGSSGVRDQLQELLMQSDWHPVSQADSVGWSGRVYHVAIPVRKGLTKSDFDTKIATNDEGTEFEVVSGTVYRLAFA